MEEIASQPADGTPREADYTVAVTKTSHMQSGIVKRLQPGTKIHLLSTCVLNDGTRRACVALQGSISALGWVSARNESGAPLFHRYARPLYEVVSPSPLKLRRLQDKNSQFVAQIAEGTRLHIAEIKKTADGDTRASVVVLGHSRIPDERPAGWITVMKSSNPVATIRELPVDGCDPVTPTSGSGLNLRVSEPKMQLPTKHPSLPPTPWLAALSSPPASPPRPKPGSPSARSSPDSLKPTTFGFYTSPVIGHDEPITSRVAVAPTWPLTACSSRGLGSSPAKKRPAKKKSPPSGGEVPGSPDGDAGDEKPRNTWQARLQKHKAALAAAAGGKEGLAKEKPKDKNEPKELFKSSFIQKAIDEILKAADEEEKVLDKKGFRNLAMQLGDMVGAKSAADKTGNFVDNLMREWDPNRDGTITKMEFRGNVRKMLPKADTKEIDDLFNQLDDDHSGEMDVSEIKGALRKLQKSAAAAAATQSAVLARSAEMRAKAERLRGVKAETLVYEEAVLELEAAEKKGVGAALGFAIKEKGLNVNDIVSKWGNNKPGQVSKKEFRDGVRGVLPSTSGAEVDTLFGTLDADGGGALDTEELKDALRMLIKESAAVKDLVRNLKAKVAEVMKPAKAAQGQWRKEKREEEEAAAAEVERLAREAEEQEARAAEEKAAKLAAAAAKAAAAAAEKAEQDARIAAKRKAAQES